VQKPTELKADRKEPLTIDLTEHQQLIVNRTEIKMNEVEDLWIDLCRYLDWPLSGFLNLFLFQVKLIKEITFQ
jgi:hypothetical protein